jgi:hypothetical protein
MWHLIGQENKAKDVPETLLFLLGIHGVPVGGILICRGFSRKGLVANINLGNRMGKVWS